VELLRTRWFRWAVPVGASALLALAALTPTSAAVIPNLSDRLSLDGAGSLRAAVLVETDRHDFAGRWSGITSAGRVVAIDLRFKSGLPRGTALLGALLPGASDSPVELLDPRIAGRTVLFAVPAECPNQAPTRGRLTVMSAGNAQLVVRTAKGPVSIALARVG
jgi:hypothetical protein